MLIFCHSCQNCLTDNNLNCPLCNSEFIEFIDDFFWTILVSSPEPFHLESYRLAEPGHEECPICMNIDSDQQVSLPCGHEFHEKCLSKWLPTSRTCPMCRAGLNI